MIHADHRGKGYGTQGLQLLIQRASEQLAAAKSLHDELEGFYIRHMDYLGWQQVLDKIVAQVV